MKRAKQKIAALALAAACMGFGVAGTVAYFEGSSDSHNVIETAPGVSLSIAKIEDTEIMPGSTVGEETVKKIKVKAKDDSATAWVRVKIDTSIELAAGATETPDPDMVTINFIDDGEADAKWHKGTGDWWYYENKLSAGNAVELPINSIHLEDWADNTYRNAKVIVSVKAQGVQVKNNGDTVSAAQGWPTE